MSAPHPVFVLHEHDRPRHHFDLRLEENGVLRSWAVPKGMPTDPAHDRLAVPVGDHELGHATYEDTAKRIADTGWWELEDRNERRTVFVLHGRRGPRRYALISTDAGALLHLVREQPEDRRPELPVETFREIVTGSAGPVTEVTSTVGWTLSSEAS